MRAIKTRKSRKRKRNRRTKRIRNLGREAIVARGAASPFIEDVVFVDGVPGLGKLSEVILEFGRPILEEATTEKEYRDAIAFVILAWDLLVLFPDGQRGTIDQTAGDLPWIERDILDKYRSAIGILTRRKQVLYGNDERFIFDYELTGGWENWYLHVCYALE